MHNWQSVLFQPPEASYGVDTKAEFSKIKAFALLSLDAKGPALTQLIAGSYVARDRRRGEAKRRRMSLSMRHLCSSGSPSLDP